MSSTALEVDMHQHLREIAEDAVDLANRTMRQVQAVNELKFWNEADTWYFGLAEGAAAAYWLRDHEAFVTIDTPLSTSGVFALPPTVHVSPAVYAHHLAWLTSRGMWEAAAVTAERGLGEGFSRYDRPDELLSLRASLAALLRRSEETRNFAALAASAIQTKSLRGALGRMATYTCDAALALCRESWTDFGDAIAALDQARTAHVDRQIFRSQAADEFLFDSFDLWDPVATLLAATAEARGCVIPKTRFSDVRWIRGT